MQTVVERPKPKYLTAEEAAQYLRLAVGTIHNLSCQGRLRVAGRAGNRLRFLERDLDRYLRESGHPKGERNARDAGT
jgi:excisionase family DNA binding protein